MRNRLARGTAIVLPAVLLAGMIALGAAGVAASVEDPCAQPTVVASSDPTAGVSPEPTPVPTAEPTPVPTAEPTPVPTVVPIPVPTVVPIPVPTVDPTPTASPDLQVRSQAMAPLPAETVPAEALPVEPSAAPSPCPDPTPDAVAVLAVGPVLTVVPDPHDLVYGHAVPTYTFTLIDNSVPAAPITVLPSSLTTYVPPICTTEHEVIVPPVTSEGAETTRTDQYTSTTSVAESPLTVVCTGGLADGYTFDTTATAALTIAKHPTTITSPPTAGDLAYGQTLHDSVLTGGSGSVPGYFTFPPDSWSYTPQVGTQSHVVAFVPDQFADYEPIGTPVNVTVTQAAAVVITPPTASALVTGQTLASSVLADGVASTTGTFAFTSPATAPADGTAAQQLTFTPSDPTSFTPTTVDVSVTVAPAPVDYTTTGYLGRVQMGDVTNMIRPRVMVPLAFTVANGGTAITDATKVKFDPVAISCEAIIDYPSEVFPSVTIGRRSKLVYDAAGGEFVQFWKVPATRNTCYRVTTTIDDTVDDTIVAYFKTW